MKAQALDLRQAIRDAKDFVETSSGEVSIITCGETVEVLANRSKDKQKLKRLLSGIEPTDASGDIRDAEGIMESLECEDIIVFTDGNGAAGLKDLTSKLSLDIKVYGKPSSNAGLTQMSMKKNEEGLYDIAVGYQTKGIKTASFDISLYDAEGNLLDVRNISLTEDSSNTILSLGFYEKAYKAVTGESIVKVTSDSDVPDEEKMYFIYDKAELVNKE